MGHAATINHTPEASINNLFGQPRNLSGLFGLGGFLGPTFNMIPIM